MWNVKGLYMEACNCEAMCPCVVGNAPTSGLCTVLLGYHVETGRKGDVTVDGLNVVRMNFSPSHMAKGNWRGAFYIDERANPAQREALSAIFSFKPRAIGRSQRQIRMSGWMPISRISRTECCVGFVLSSPAEAM